MDHGKGNKVGSDQKTTTALCPLFFIWRMEHRRARETGSLFQHRPSILLLPIEILNEGRGGADFAVMSRGNRIKTTYHMRKKRTIYVA